MRAVQAFPLLLLICAVSCSHSQTAEDPSKPPPEKTMVEVRNQKYIDFNLYVLNGTHRIRLGTVPGMSTRIFTIPPHLIVNKRGTLRFQIDPIGSDQVSSQDEDLMVREGDRISLTL